MILLREPRLYCGRGGSQGLHDRSVDRRSCIQRAEQVLTRLRLPVWCPPVRLRLEYASPRFSFARRPHTHTPDHTRPLTHAGVRPRVSAVSYPRDQRLLMWPVLGRGSYPADVLRSASACRFARAGSCRLQRRREDIPAWRTEGACAHRRSLRADYLRRGYMFWPAGTIRRRWPKALPTATRSHPHLRWILKMAPSAAPCVRCSPTTQWIACPGSGPGLVRPSCECVYVCHVVPPGCGWGLQTR